MKDERTLCEVSEQAARVMFESICVSNQAVGSVVLWGNLIKHLAECAEEGKVYYLARQLQMSSKGN